MQEPSYADLETLATLLQHGDCVVANAGTILLDALVNDRPAVCVLYDEGAPAGESWALKNVVGEHYRELVDSGAFLRADRFDDVVAGNQRCLGGAGASSQTSGAGLSRPSSVTSTGSQPNVSSRRSQGRSGRRTRSV